MEGRDSGEVVEIIEGGRRKKRGEKREKTDESFVYDGRCSP
jgi:hypothetical protein